MLDLANHPPVQLPAGLSADTAQRLYALAVLRACKGDRRAAVAILRIELATLRRWLTSLEEAGHDLSDLPAPRRGRAPVEVSCPVIAPAPPAGPLPTTGHRPIAGLRVLRAELH